MTDIPDADPAWTELRTWSREYVEGQLASARMLAMHARSKREREHHSRRARRLVEVLEGMDEKKAPQACETKTGLSSGNRHQRRGDSN